MATIVDLEKCTGCGICAEICPGDILTIENQVAKVVYPNECEYCGVCMMDFKFDSINVILPRNGRPVILRGPRD